MGLCVRIIELRNQYKFAGHDKDHHAIDYSANIIYYPSSQLNQQSSSLKLVQYLSLTHEVNDDQLLLLVRISCPRPEDQLKSSSLTRLCLIKYIPIPPQLYLLIARASNGFIMTFYHT